MSNCQPGVGHKISKCTQFIAGKYFDQVTQLAVPYLNKTDQRQLSSNNQSLSKDQILDKVTTSSKSNMSKLPYIMVWHRSGCPLAQIGTSLSVYKGCIPYIPLVHDLGYKKFAPIFYGRFQWNESLTLLRN